MVEVPTRPPCLRIVRFLARFRVTLGIGLRTIEKLIHHTWRNPVARCRHRRPGGESRPEVVGSPGRTAHSVPTLTGSCPGQCLLLAPGVEGLGNLVAGVGLDVISWPRGSEIQVAADIQATTIANLGILYGPIVAGFAVVSVWCYSHYRLNRARHREIVAELEVARRVALASEG